VSAIRQDGSRFPAEITRSPFDIGDDLYLTTAIRDDTLQVEAEERIHRLNAELEKRVNERTVMLTRSNEALRQFAWAASHDLQEPIRMVVSFSQLAERSAGAKLDSSEAKMLRFIQENGMRMQNLLAALRQYIVISESGEQEWTPVDCNAAVRTAVANLDGRITESEASIAWDPLPTIPSLEVLLVQLFQNLIGNAIKYRSKERPEIAIAAERRQDAWLFSVTDNGVGIGPEYVAYIFGIFKRLNRDDDSGTGIGLAIVQKGVERMGGRVGVESAAGQGSRFWFELRKA
jgi:light-regulated signal transduction histidine kinase (bacteriophytochrome)